MKFTNSTNQVVKEDSQTTAKVIPNDSSSSPERLIKREARAVWYLRWAGLVFLFCCSCGAAFAVYSSAAEAQRRTFEADAEAIGSNLVEAFVRDIGLKLWTLQALSASLTVHSIGQNMPNVTFPEFDALTESARLYSRFPSIAWSPILHDVAERKAWEAYAANRSATATATNNPVCFHCGDKTLEVDNKLGEIEIPGYGSIQCGYLEAGGVTKVLTEWECSYTSPLVVAECGCKKREEEYKEANIRDVSAGIFRLEGNTSIDQTGNGPFAPIWNGAPISSMAPGILLDQMSVPRRHQAITEMINGKSVAISAAEVDGRRETNTETGIAAGSPRSVVFFPVFHHKDPELIAGALSAEFSWEGFFDVNLPPNSAGIVIVAENSCGQAHTFQINHKWLVEYVGESDQHDPSFDDMEVASRYEEFAIYQRYAMRTDDTSYVGCAYRIRTYPSLEFRNSRITKTPLLLGISIIAVFLFSTIVFGAYDLLTRRMQTKVLEEAKKSSALVSSVFPASVRDRLLHGAGNGDQQIADLFTSVTIMFADIQGFTAWSSERDPQLVFKLLESLYAEFDRIAKLMGVYKIETIGDCYVACSGLPTPCEEHAVVMADFASACMANLKALTQSLEMELGPGTADLGMRFGLHSGPVTAGVLRGDRCRFQLFGDTMNVAARMESTGVVNSIHVSPATEKLLAEAGKMEWLSRRQKPIAVRGKGRMQTYFYRDPNLVGTVGPPSSKRSIMSIMSDTSADVECQELADTRVERLVEWNSMELYRLLKRVVARRAVVKPNSKDELLMGGEETETWGVMVYDEIEETINMPEFNEKAALADNKNIEMHSMVLGQLKDYVKRIADSYNDTPFHNFEHASHVALSASKLMKRILNPNDVDYRGGTKSKQKSIAILKDIHDCTYGISSDPLLQFAAVFSALIHDAGHEGVTNAQLIEENSPLASKYKNKSVAEQNSVCVAWDMLMEAKYSILRRAIFTTRLERTRFRKLLINAVLATDIADPDLRRNRKERWDRAFHNKNRHLMTACEATNVKATIVYEQIIIASDVSHTMQHWHIYQKWNQRLYAEKYRAFLEGREPKHPKLGWNGGEIWFFDNYIIPVAKNLAECGVFGVSCHEYLTYAEENRREWEHRGEQVTQEMVEMFEQSHDVSSRTEI